MPHQQLKALAETISAAAALLSDFYDEETLELQFPGGRPTQDQGRAIGGALHAALQLQRMLLGPIGSIMSLSANEYDLAALQVIHEFSIAKLVPSEGTITYDELSIASGIPTFHLKRIMRYAMTNRIFTEPAENAVAHTIISRRLAGDPVMMATVNMLTTEQYPASANLSRALRDRNALAKAEGSAWALANSAKRPMVEEIETNHPERAAYFSQFMKLNWSTQHPIQPLLDNFDWAGLGSGHVVDVGGGMGHVSIMLAKAFPQLTCTVQDFEAVVEAGRSEFLKETEGQESVQKRVNFATHDAFNTQPIRDADVYLLRSVLHDWPDDACVKILKSLTPALKPGAKVLINDFVMPGRGELAFMDERRTRTLDLVMLSLFNAGEREAGEWGPLFARADPRYRFQGVKYMDKNSTGIPTKKLLAIVEATWNPPVTA